MLRTLCEYGIISYCIEYGGRNPVFTYPATVTRHCDTSRSGPRTLGGLRSESGPNPVGPGRAGVTALTDKAANTFVTRCMPDQATAFQHMLPELAEVLNTVQVPRLAVIVRCERVPIPGLDLVVVSAPEQAAVKHATVVLHEVEYHVADEHA